jgi:hypothetical protein
MSSFVSSLTCRQRSVIIPCKLCLCASLLHARCCDPTHLPPFHVVAICLNLVNLLRHLPCRHAGSSISSMIWLCCCSGSLLPSMRCADLLQAFIG